MDKKDIILTVGGALLFILVGFFLTKYIPTEDRVFTSMDSPEIRAVILANKTCIVTVEDQDYFKKEYTNCSEVIIVKDSEELEKVYRGKDV